MSAGRRTARGAACAVLALVMGTAACGGDATASPTTVPSRVIPCGTSTTEVYATHSGVDPNLTSLDLHLPDAGPDGCSDLPLVVWVHGGAWTGGDKTDHIDDKIRLFTDAGYAFATVNYRLTDNTVEPTAPRHPVHDDDTATALAWLVDHAPERGIDTDRIAVLGHSAGGGIVAAISTDGAYLGRHDLGLAAVRCAGSIDGEGYDVAVGATHPEPFVHDVYLDAFGEDPAVWEQASPLRHIAAGTGIPDYFVSARGPDIRLDLHLEFVAALDAAGVPVSVFDARNLDHAQVSTEIGAPDDTEVTPALMSFLEGCFAA